MHRVWAVFCLLLLAPALSADEWVYTVRPGDNLWNFSNEYLKGVEYWPKVKALNGITHPRQLQPGTRLRIPVAWLKHQPKPARLIALHGDVKHQPTGGTARAAKVGMSVFSGDAIETGPGGSATIEFADGSRLLIETGSRVVMDTLGVFRETGMVDTSLRLERGRVESTVKPLKENSRFQINTPAAVAAVRGTRYRVQADADHAIMRSEVLEGNVGVTGADVTQNVAAGFGTVAEAGRPPAPPRALLPAPELAGLPRRIGPDERRLSWPALSGAETYRAQLSADPSFSALLMDQALTGPAVELPRLALGDYVFRVRAGDDLGLEGQSAVHSFTVAMAPTAPSPTTPGDGAQITINQPWLAWHAVEQAASYVVQIAKDKAFAQDADTIAGIHTTHYKSPVPLPDGHYYWRVAAVDAYGLRSEFSAARGFVLVGRPEP
ncbi:MAG TPA: LysM peptidoglycan-binding domain-containing protein [Gammaproteobacteria bacterium]|nr:LysM peptidoglycan-binding domain-containing protein [Gammaproteobacteria bacterium]